MLSTDIPRMTSKYVEIVPPSYQQGNYILFAAIRWLRFGNRPEFGSPFSRFPAIQTPSPVVILYVRLALAAVGRLERLEGVEPEPRRAEALDPHRHQRAAETRGELRGRDPPLLNPSGNRRRDTIVNSFRVRHNLSYRLT